MAEPRTDPQVVAAGVEELLRRIREEGVVAARQQAEELRAEAERSAREVVAAANAEAERIEAAARAEADAIRRGGVEALGIAARDTMLALKTELSQRLQRVLGRLVSDELAKAELLREMIQEIAGRAGASAASSDRLRVLLPREVVSIEELHEHPEQLDDSALPDFMRMLSADMLRDGVTFGVAADGKGGLRVQLDDDGITLDLSDAAITELLMQHLQPRFRAMLQGLVR